MVSLEAQSAKILRCHFCKVHTLGHAEEIQKNMWKSGGPCEKCSRSPHVGCQCAKELTGLYEPHLRTRGRVTCGNKPGMARSKEHKSVRVEACGSFYGVDSSAEVEELYVPVPQHKDRFGACFQVPRPFVEASFRALTPQTRRGSTYGSASNKFCRENTPCRGRKQKGLATRVPRFSLFRKEAEPQLTVSF